MGGAAFVLGATWIVFFVAMEAVIEVRPLWLNALGPILKVPYFAFRKDYVPDDKLVFVYRHTNMHWQTKMIGDLYRPEFNVPVEPFEYTVSNSSDGFRTNSLPPPHDVVVIGDSFVEMAEDDGSTVSELLGEDLGTSVRNLGRGFYGPYQYLEVLKRFALADNPRVVVFSFFGGNDFEDILQYERWQQGGDYYAYPNLSQSGVFGRFVRASREVFGLLLEGTRSFWVTPAHAALPSMLYRVRLGDREVPIAFGYWERPPSPAQQAALGRIVDEFRAFCLARGIAIVFLYIPSAVHVYGRMIVAGPEHEYLTRVKSGDFDPSRDGFRSVLSARGLPFVDLTESFAAEARSGILVFHPFDTHWNRHGRTIAAAALAREIRKLSALPQISSK